MKKSPSRVKRSLLLKKSRYLICDVEVVKITNNTRQSMPWDAVGFVVGADLVLHNTLYKCSL